MTKPPGVLILSENLTVPLDRRVWQEACALRDAGYVVSIICPKTLGREAGYELLERVHIFRHPLPFEARTPAGYAIEYACALACQLALSVRVQAKVGFDVVQACNPPDLMFLIGALWKGLAGKAFIFDHHDPVPALAAAKFGLRWWPMPVLRLLERASFALADAAIATNETGRAAAIARGDLDAGRAFVVRSRPDVARFRRTIPNLALKNGCAHLIGYVGITGAQDGVDLLIEAIAELAKTRSRRDFHCAIVGSGPDLPALIDLASRRGVADRVTFTGFLTGEPLLEAMSAFDSAVIPDPKNGYTDAVSMNKVYEYMALAIPFVGFDLIENARIAGPAALMVSGTGASALASGMARLIDDPALRETLAAAARDRTAQSSGWDSERAQLLAAYEFALQRQRGRASAAAGRLVPR
jgi:glycosyltransferase involved in cell wall biosynthesis